MVGSSRKWIPKVAAALVFLLGSALMAQAQGALRPQRRPQNPRRARPLIGKVTAKQEKSFDMTLLRLRRRAPAASQGQAAQRTLHVSLTDRTRIMKKTRGDAKDLTVDSFVAVFGEREEGRIHAKGIVKFAALSDVSESELQGLAAASMPALRLLMGPLPAQGSPAEGTQRRPAGWRPLFGKITASQPLTVTNRFGDKVEILIEPDTRIWTDTPITFGEVKEGDIVSVVGRPVRPEKPGAPGEVPPRIREIEAHLISVLPELPKGFGAGARRPRAS